MAYKNLNYGYGTSSELDSDLLDSIYSSNSSSDHGFSKRSRYAKGGLSLVKIAFCILLVFVVFNYMYHGVSNGWSFTRLLKVLQNAPNVSSSVTKSLLSTIVQNDYDFGTGVLGLLLGDIWRILRSILSLVDFFATAVLQMFVFIRYILELLFL